MAGDLSHPLRFSESSAVFAALDVQSMIVYGYNKIGFFLLFSVKPKTTGMDGWQWVTITHMISIKTTVFRAWDGLEW